jgi:rare lipoprotein A
MARQRRESIVNFPKSLGFAFFVALGLTISSCATMPMLNSAPKQEGVASYYSNDFQGKRTTSGEIFDNSQYTAAHRSYPFGTIVRVTNLKNSQQVDVKINDRGPNKASRIIDLSLAAAKAIGMVRDGLAQVRIEVLKLGSVNLSATQ